MNPPNESRVSTCCARVSRPRTGGDRQVSKGAGVAAPVLEAGLKVVRRASERPCFGTVCVAPSGQHFHRFVT